MMRKRSPKPSSSIEMETTTDVKEKPEEDLLEYADNGMTEGDLNEKEHKTPSK